MSGKASAWLIIGVGNEMRGDDAAGIAAARELARMEPEAAAIEASGEGAELIELFSGAGRVMVFDAAQSGSEPGTIHRLDASADKIPMEFFRYSTHAFSLAEAVELARVLDGLPAKLVIYGIEGRNWDTGAPLSLEVAQAAREAAARARAEMREISAHRRKECHEA
ncbi:MAG: hydrogenase maturation protease [bacterium]